LEINSGDTAWILTCSALVLMMTIPGLFLFYGGLVRTKNVLGTIMQSFVAACVISIVWVLWGYSLAFGPDVGGIVGNLDWFALNGVGAEPNADLVAGVPHLAFMVFQMMFAIITPALITGAFAERAKFSTFIVFVILWSTFIYAPLCHWVWGGGWMGAMGALDFAGGTVVHISSGISALAAAMVYGARRGYGRDAMMPHNLPFSVIGASLLWVGWFGFNAGSTVAGTDLSIALIALNTNVAAAAGAVGALFTAWIWFRKPDPTFALNGAIAGLVSITAGCAFVAPAMAVLIGLAGGVLVVLSVELLDKVCRIDDPIGAVSAHGVCGAWGTLAVGLFANEAIGGVSGLFFGGGLAQLGVQFVGVVAVFAWTMAAGFVLFAVIKAVMGLRVSRDEELRGLDIDEHGAEAYSGFQIFSSQ
jgi:Amt family ammonium transporter